MSKLSFCLFLALLRYIVQKTKLLYKFGTFRWIMGHSIEGLFLLTALRCISGDTALSRAETDQFTLLQLFLQAFQLVVNLWCKLALKKREWHQMKKKWARVKTGRGGEGAAQRSCFLRSLMLQLAWLACLVGGPDVSILGKLSLAKAVPGNVPDFNMASEIDAASVTQAVRRLMQYHF